MPIDVSPEAVERIRELSIIAAITHPELFDMPIDRGQETLKRETREPNEPVSIWDMSSGDREAYIRKYYLIW